MFIGKKEEVEQLKKELETLKKEIEEMKSKNKEYLSGWQRAKADYINREREIERERSEWLEFAAIGLVLKILPIYESLNNSLNHKAENQDFIKGIEQIKKQFDEFLKNLGVEKIKTVGEKFNPEFHEAVSKESTNSKEQITNNIITEEVSPGYALNGRVIKVAKVIIR